MLPASPKARAVFSSTVFAGKTLQWGEKNRPKKLMRFCETKNARQKEKRLLLSSFSSSSRGGRGRRRRGMSYLSTLPTSSSASAASASSSSSSSSSARFAFSRTTHQNRKSTSKAAFSNRQRREKTAAVVVARGCGKAESDGSGTREVNRAKDDDEASSGASRRENAREENDEEEENDDDTKKEDLMTDLVLLLRLLKKNVGDLRSIDCFLYSFGGFAFEFVFNFNLISSKSGELNSFHSVSNISASEFFKTSFFEDSYVMSCNPFR